MTKDFKASQVRTTQIIASGSQYGKPAMMIVSASSPGVDFDGGGINNATTLAGVGSDVFLFVSGAIGSKNSASVQGVTVFGGDLVFSGNLYNGSGNVIGGGPDGNEGYIQFVESGDFGSAAQFVYDKTKDSLTQGTALSATGFYSHAQGVGGTAVGEGSHAEGASSTASGDYSHGEGNSTTASGDYSHAEGNTSISSGPYSHAEGETTTASGNSSHSEGSTTTASGDASHAEGGYTIAKGLFSHAGGYYTIASGTAQTVVGKYNKQYNDSALFIIGNGTNSTIAGRNDAIRVESLGTYIFNNLYASGSARIGDASSDALQVTANSWFDNNLNVSGSVIIAGNLEVRGMITGSVFAITSSNLTISDNVIYMASGTSVSNTNGGIAIASGSDTANQALVFGRVGTNTWGAGKLDVTAGTKTDLTGMTLVPLRASRFEVGASNSMILNDTDQYNMWVIASTGIKIDPGTTGYGLRLGNTFTSTAVTSSDVRIGNISSEFNSEIPSQPGLDSFFFVSGSISSKDTSVRGVAVFGGDVVISGVLHGGSPLKIGNNLNLSGSLRMKTQNSAPTVGSNEAVLYVLDDGGTKKLFWKNSDNVEQEVGTGGGGGGGGDSKATYVVMSATGSLSSERVLTAGTGVSITDGGAGGNVTLAVNDSIVATVSGTTFTGIVKANAGLSGSITKLTDGTSYIIAGNNVTITSSSNGAITINSTGGGGGSGDPDATYLVLSSTGSLSNERVITAGTGISTTDGGAGGNYTIAINDSVVATVSGTTFTGVVKVNSGVSGSLTRLVDGTSYLIAGSGIAIVTGSNGAVTITNDGTVGDITAVTAGTGLSGGGSSGAVTLNINDSVVATVSGTTFTGVVKASSGISGSLTKLTDGTSYLLAGSGIAITTGSNGAITITNDGTVGDITAVTAGTGLTGGGSSGAVTLNINDSVVATVSGTTFTGVVKANAGISGSLTKLSNGTSYLIAGSNVTVTTGTNGAVTIASSGGAPGGADTQVQFNSGGSTFGGSSNLTWNDSTGILTSKNISFPLGGALTGSKHAPGPYYNLLLAADSLGSSKVIVTNRTAMDSTNAETSSTFGNDAFFVVSGSIGSAGTSTKGTALFVGDTVISGSTKARGGISGSLTQLTDGTSYLIAGTNVTITTGSNGAVTIDAAGGGGGGSGDPNATYLVLSATGSLNNERVITAGTGISTTDAGAGGNYTIAINDSVVATVSGTTFTGVVKANSGLSGSLTRLTDGTSYLIAGSGISITTGSGGAVTITNDGTVGDITAVTAGTGLTGGGSSGAVTLNISDSVVATVSGTTFTGVVKANSGLSGSLTKLTDGSSYLIAGSNVTVTTGSNGAVTIAGTVSQSTGTFNDVNSRMVTTASVSFAGSQGATYFASSSVGGDVFFYVSGTSAVQKDTANTGKVAVFGGAVVLSSSLMGGYNSFLGITSQDLVAQRFIFKGTQTGITTTGLDVAFLVSGSTNSRGTSTRGTAVFVGDLYASGVSYFSQGISGSHTKLADGTSYLIAGSNVTITTGSNGAVTIASTGGGGGTGTGFNDGGNKLNTTSSVSFAGGLGSSYYSDSVGSDVFLFVSGTQFQKGTAGAKTSVFGGDVVVSGVLHGGVSSFTGNTLLNLNASNIVLYGGAVQQEATKSDISVFISGAIGSKNGSNKGVTVLGGDVVISGTLYGGSPLKVAGGLQLTGTLDISSDSTSKIKATAISGSLTNLSDGTSYLVAGSNVTITTGSNGSVTIDAAGGGGGGSGDPNATYLVLSATGSLSNERVITAGTGISATDGGAGGNYTIAISDSVVATVSGTTFTGVIKANAGLSGSLTKLTDGSSYLIAGSNVTITTGSNGAVTIASTGGGGSGTGFNDGGNKLNTTSSVAFAGGLASSYYADSVGSDVFFFVSGTQIQKGSAGAKTSVFGGDVVVSGVLHGGFSSLTNDTLLNANANNIVFYGGAVQQEATRSDISFFVSGAIGSKNGANKGTSVFGGDVVISGTLYNANGTAYSTGGGGGDSAATYVVISATGSLANERVLTAGTGISINDAGAGGNVTLSINDAIVATVSGTNFTGAVGVGSFVGPSGVASTGSLVVRAGPNNDSFFGAGCQTIHLIGTASAGHGGSIIFGDYASTYGVGIMEDIDDAILIKSKNRAQVKSTTSTINLDAGTQVLINAESVSPSPTTFTDTNFFVAGTVGSKNSATLGTAVFGGDMMISGSTYVASGQSIFPVADRTSDLGSPSKRWGNVYTGDLHLRNDRGDWTIVEEEDYLCVVNNKTGKKFKMALIPLEE